MYRLMSILSFLFLSACATQMTVLDKTYPAITPDKVTVLFNEKPKCNSKQIAFLNSSTAWSQNDALRSLRKSAASIGADYVSIFKTEVITASDTVFHGVAYKCMKG